MAEATQTAIYILKYNERIIYNKNMIEPKEIYYEKVFVVNFNDGINLDTHYYF